MLYSCYWGCQVSTGDTGPGLRAERYRPRKIRTQKQVPITLRTLPFPSLHKRLETA
jgi:hypothetical protein